MPNFRISDLFHPLLAIGCFVLWRDREKNVEDGMGSDGDFENFSKFPRCCVGSKQFLAPFLTGG